MFDQARRRRAQMSARSQLATELLLIAFSAVGSIILLRTVLVVLDVSDRVWIGQFVYGITNPVTRLLAYLPGASHTIYGNLTVVDVTLLGGIFLFLLGLVATGGGHDYPVE
jgi:uncharacterized protein YggT (Ycf19 family)